MPKTNVKKTHKISTRKHVRAKFTTDTATSPATEKPAPPVIKEPITPPPIEEDAIPRESAENPQVSSPEEEKPHTPAETSDTDKPEVREPEKKSEPLKDNSTLTSVPSIDPNAPLKVEELAGRTSSVPTIDKNAPLKVDEVSISDELSIKEKSNKKLFLLGIVVFTAIIVFTGIFATFWLNIKPTQDVEELTDVTPSPEVVAPTKPAIVKSSISFEVLNGSGVAGAAKKYAENLQSLGYSVVKIGNADKSDYDKTLLYVAGGYADKMDTVLTDLSISSVSGTLTDSTASARIIIGKD